MGGIRKQYDEEFKKNAVKLSHASPRPVREIAEDLGIHENVLYNWRRKYTAEGDKTKYATLEEENRDLQRQLAEVKMERDMLKKRRPTSQKTKSKVSIHPGKSRISGREVGQSVRNRTERLLCLAQKTQRSGADGKKTEGKDQRSI